MVEKENYLELKEYSQKLETDLFGVADISSVKADFMLARELLEKLDRAVCLGVGLSCATLEEIHTQPTKIYFHHYRTLNAFLDQAALRMVNFIQRKGFSALAIPASQIVDWQAQKAHLSHKKIATLAGLGWIGRNNLLVNKKLGSQLRLVTILTDMPLVADNPSKDACGDCRRCLDSCPAKAIKENPADFDHLGCFEKLKEFQKQRIVDQYICGVCVNVCFPSSRQV